METLHNPTPRTTVRDESSTTVAHQPHPCQRKWKHTKNTIFLGTDRPRTQSRRHRRRWPGGNIPRGRPDHPSFRKKRETTNLTRWPQTEPLRRSKISSPSTTPGEPSTGRKIGIHPWPSLPPPKTPRGRRPGRLTPTSPARSMKLRLRPPAKRLSPQPPKAKPPVPSPDTTPRRQRTSSSADAEEEMDPPLPNPNLDLES